MANSLLKYVVLNFFVVRYYNNYFYCHYAIFYIILRLVSNIKINDETPESNSHKIYVWFFLLNNNYYY